MKTRFAMHELCELHEMTAFKALCATKAKSMQLLVSCPDLRALLVEDADRSTRQVQELQNLLAMGVTEGESV